MSSKNYKLQKSLLKYNIFICIFIIFGLMFCGFTAFGCHMAKEYASVISMAIKPENGNLIERILVSFIVYFVVSIISYIIQIVCVKSTNHNSIWRLGLIAAIINGNIFLVLLYWGKDKVIYRHEVKEAEPGVNFMAYDSKDV